MRAHAFCGPKQRSSGLYRRGVGEPEAACLFTRTRGQTPTVSAKTLRLYRSADGAAAGEHPDDEPIGTSFEARWRTIPAIPKALGASSE